MPTTAAANAHPAPAIALTHDEIAAEAQRIAALPGRMGQDVSNWNHARRMLEATRVLGIDSDEIRTQAFQLWKDEGELLDNGTSMFRHEQQATLILAEKARVAANSAGRRTTIDDEFVIEEARRVSTLPGRTGPANDDANWNHARKILEAMVIYGISRADINERAKQIWIAEGQPMDQGASMFRHEQRATIDLINEARARNAVPAAAVQEQPVEKEKLKPESGEEKKIEKDTKAGKENNDPDSKKSEDKKEENKEEEKEEEKKDKKPSRVLSLVKKGTAIALIVAGLFGVKEYFGSSGQQQPAPQTPVSDPWKPYPPRAPLNLKPAEVPYYKKAFDVSTRDEFARNPVDGLKQKDAVAVIGRDSNGNAVVVADPNFIKVLTDAEESSEANDPAFPNTRNEFLRIVSGMKPGEYIILDKNAPSIKKSGEYVSAALDHAGNADDRVGIRSVFRRSIEQGGSWVAHKAPDKGVTNTVLAHRVDKDHGEGIGEDRTYPLALTVN